MSEDWEATDWEAINLGGYQRKSVPEFSTGIATPQFANRHQEVPTNTHLKESEAIFEHATLRTNNHRSQITSKHGEQKAKQKNQQQYRT